MNCEQAMLNLGIKLFLKQFYPEVLERRRSLFLSGAAAAIQAQEPDIWQEFARYVKNEHHPGFLAGVLQSQA
jgi:hypothetical protein